MKRYLKTFLIFMAPIAFLAIVPPIVEWQVFLHAVRQPQARIGITGDSLIGAGVDPAEFPGLANFAQATTQPVIWRAKLGPILDVNPQIDTFVVECWSGILTRNAELSSTERAQFSRGWGPAITLYDIFRTKEMGGLPKQDFGRNFVRGVVWPFLKRCVTWSDVTDLFLGLRTLDNKVEDSDWWRNGCALEYHNWGEIPSINNTSAKQEMCDVFEELTRRKIRIVVLTPPLMKVSSDQIMSEGIREWADAQIKELCERYHARWINALDWMPEPRYYQDSIHLNSEGAQVFSRKLQRELGRYDAR